MKLSDRIGELVYQHGSYRSTARVLGIDAGYLFRLGSGEKIAPGIALLRRMGLRRVVEYHRLTKKPKRK